MPLFWLSLAFVSGILLAEWAGWKLVVWVGLGGLALFLLAVFRWRPPAFLRSAPAGLSWMALLLVLALGGVRLQLARFEPGAGQIAWYNESPTQWVIEGRVAGWPEQRDRDVRLLIETERLRPASAAGFTPVSGRLLATLPSGGEWHYGDRLQLQGWLRTPSSDESFSYRDYLARQGVYALLACRACAWCPVKVDLDCSRLLERSSGHSFLGWVYRLRARALAVVYQLLPDPEASLLAGILLGVEAGIPEDVEQAFIDTGTAHIIAISGANFAVVAGLLTFLLGGLLGRWRGMLAAGLGMALYALLAGAGAGVVRAALIGGMAVFAVQIGRRQNGLNSLAFIAALMAVYNPYVLWDVSFQLSFAATLGLVLYAGPLQAGFENLASRRWRPDLARRISILAGEYVLVTLAAQLTTLPVILYHFQRLSLSALLANPLVLPAQPPVMALGGLAVLPALAWLPLGRPGALLVWPFLAYTIRVIELLARLPGASWVAGPVSLGWVAAFYGLLFALTFWGGALRSRLSAGFSGWRGPAAWAALLLLAAGTLWTWQRLLAAPDGLLHVTVLDVGSGDALLIQTPGGRDVLIDGGPSPRALSDALGRRLPFGQRQLDYLVIAGTREESLAALPQTLERFSPLGVLWAGERSAGYSARLLNRAFDRAVFPVTQAAAGHVLDLGDGAALEVLAVTEEGALLVLSRGNFRCLLPVGLDPESLAALLRDPRQPPVTALLLAGRGAADLNPPEWIARWQPQVLLLSVGGGDRDGYPDARLIQALQDYPLLRTDRNGWIELSTDGEQMWITVENP